MKWKVNGADARTGKDVCIVVESESSSEAGDIANRKGILVSSVDPAVTRAHVSPAAGCFALLVVAMIFAGCGGFFYSAYKTALLKARDSEDSQAIAASREYVRASLKDPSSASFPWTDDGYTVRSLPGERCAVGGTVEAKNSFNATVKQYWVVELHRDRNGKDWIPDRLTFSTP